MRSETSHELATFTWTRIINCAIFTLQYEDDGNEDNFKQLPDFGEELPTEE